MMRKLLAVLPIIAIVVIGNALVVSAGLTEEGAAPPTFGYTVLLFEADDASVPEPSSDTTVETTEDAAATSPGVGALDDGVQPLQGSGCELARVDFATGVVTPIATSASQLACAGDLAFTPDGSLYGIVRLGRDPVTNLVRFDPATGAVTDLGQITAFNTFGGFSEVPIGGIASDATGTLFVALQGGDADEGTDPGCVEQTCLYRIDDPTNPGAATLVAPTDPTAFVSTLASSCTTLYAGDFRDSFEANFVSTVDPSTAVLSALGQMGEDRFLFGADFDRAGTFWAIEAIGGEDIAFFVGTLNPAGGTPIDTVGAALVLPDEAFYLNALTVEPLDCILDLEPTFTG